MTILGKEFLFVSGEHDNRGGGTILTIPGNDVKFQEFLFVSGEDDNLRLSTFLTILGNDVKFQEFLGTEILWTSNNSRQKSRLYIRRI